MIFQDVSAARLPPATEQMCARDAGPGASPRPRAQPWGKGSRWPPALGEQRNTGWSHCPTPSPGHQSVGVSGVSVAAPSPGHWSVRVSGVSVAATSPGPSIGGDQWGQCGHPVIWAIGRWGSMGSVRLPSHLGHRSVGNQWGRCDRKSFVQLAGLLKGDKHRSVPVSVELNEESPCRSLAQVDAENHVRAALSSLRNHQ